MSGPEKYLLLQDGIIIFLFRKLKFLDFEIQLFKLCYFTIIRNVLEFENHQQAKGDKITYGIAWLHSQAYVSASLHLGL